MDRAEVLKNIQRKIAHANRLGLKEIKFPINEMNDLAEVINDMLCEYFASTQGAQVTVTETKDSDNEEVTLDGGSFKK